ncbi:MAG TPA: hypothetical protein VHY32_11425 [Caulobacteraceae bacterium]|nr:hypothetical protein [Caulobacteraceae bacterium]
MASFSASEAALTGFRIVRERPKAVATWAVIQFVISLGFAYGMVAMAGPALASLNALGGQPAHDPAQTLALFRQLAPFYLSLVVFSLIFYPMLYSTMNRVVLRPAEEGIGYIRLGADEVRQLGLFLLVAAIGLAAYIALFVVIVVIAAALGAVFGGGGKTAAYMVVGLVAVLLGFIAIGGWIYVWVRLSLASPLTFATRRVNLFGSWRMTRGLFWPLFGAYAVAVILAIIVSLLTVVISMAVAAVAGGGTGGLGAILHPDMSSVAVYMTPGRVVSLAIGAVSSALVWPVLLTPAASIYRSLNGAGDQYDAAAAFD